MKEVVIFHLHAKALLLLLLTSSSVAQGCSPPSGYELRVSPYYKTFSTPASFDAAKSACQADGAHLVYFRTDVEESNLWHYASSECGQMSTLPRPKHGT